MQERIDLLNLSAVARAYVFSRNISDYQSNDIIRAVATRRQRAITLIPIYVGRMFNFLHIAAKKPHSLHKKVEKKTSYL